MPPCSDFEAFRAPVPGAGVFDSPAVSLCLNTQWASHLDGLLSQLLNPCFWAGTETEIELAVGEVHKLLVKLADVGECEAQGVTIPIGGILEWAAANPPAGFLLCQGQAVSRATYANLYAVIGDTFGTGDGSTTFNLPDLCGRAPLGVGTGTGLTARALGDKLGAETHTLSTAEMPSHSHTLLYRTQGIGNNGGVSGLQSYAQGTAQTAATGGGAAHNNMQPSLALNFIIYAGTS